MKSYDTEKLEFVSSYKSYVSTHSRNQNFSLFESILRVISNRGFSPFLSTTLKNSFLAHFPRTNLHVAVRNVI